MNLQKLDDLLISIEQCIKKPVLITSFGPSTLVILHRIAVLGLHIPVMTINTGYTFPETLRLKRELESRYGIEIGVISADEPQTRPVDGDACCKERKVIPLNKILAGYDCWITGTRRDQNQNRQNLEPISRDNQKRIRYAPLAYWTEGDVWKYLLENNVPYNPLHDQGFASIGCWPCTKEGEGRAGRWQGQKSECGIHL